MATASGRRSVAVLAAVGFAVAAIVMSGGVASAVSGPVEVGGVRPVDAAISGDRVVYADRPYGHWDIFLYDASTGETKRLVGNKSDQIQPAISGDLVVWVDYRDGDADIWTYDLLTNKASQLINVVNDQVNPSIDGSWVVWEDYRSGYSPGIYGMDLTSPRFGGFRIASGYNAPMQRPVVADGFVVWEDRSDQSLGRGDPDIRGVDLTTFNPSSPAYVDVARTPGVAERAPWTDGEHVVWSADAAGGADVYAYEIATGDTKSLSSDEGEQADAVVSDGIAYWLNNVEGERLHYRTHDFDTGRTTTFNSYGTGDMVGLRADGGSTAWLESSGGEWSVRGIIDEAPLASLAESIDGLAMRLAGFPSRLAQLVTGGDTEGPEVLSASVEPGEVEVETDRPLAVYFSEELDPATVNGGTVVLVDDEVGEVVSAEVGFSPLTDAVTIEPVEPLDEGSYTLSVSGHVTDEAGNPLGQEFVASFSSFTWFYADTAPPTKPNIQDIRVIGLTDVRVFWSPSSDNVGVTGYNIYRYGEPIDAANKALAEFVDTVGGGARKATVPVAVDEESPRKYTYYYVVTAFDAEGNESAVSANMTPNPHGTYVFGKNTRNCQMCHSVHGTPGARAALNAKSAEACYECHGDTESTGSYGYSSTIDAEYDFFEDSADASLTVTRHRTNYAMATQQECDMCHTPHRRPANVDVFGTKDNDTSYSKLLKQPVDASVAATNPGVEYEYSTDTTAFGNDLCFTCHGTESAYMNSRGGDTAYSDAGGDHDATAFGSSAHDSVNVPATTRAADNPGPSISCAACHDEHASRNRGLTSYRWSTLRDTTFAQAGLCFECHSGNNSDTGDPGADKSTQDGGATALNTWNSRDVYDEFQRGAGGGSNHPYTVTLSTATVTGSSWNQTTEADFSGDVLSSTVTTPVGDGAVELERPWSVAPQSDVAEGYVPNGTITNGDWNRNGWNYTDIDEYPTANDGDYVEGDGGVASQYNLETIDIPANATNIRVEVRSRARDDNSGTNNYWVRWRTGGTWRSLSSHNPPGTTWTNFDDTITEPGNGVWTVAEVEAIDAIGLDSSDANPRVRVSQLYLEVTYDIPGVLGGYKGSGSVVTPNVVVPGTHAGWKTLTVSATVPSGTTMTVDVIDVDTGSAFSGYDDLVLSTGSNAFSLALPLGINHATDPQIRLRADLFGDVVVPTARSVSDSFADSVFDTQTPLPRWFDVPTLGGATDPDAGAATPWSDTETFPNLNNWTVTSNVVANGTWALNAGAARMYKPGTTNATAEAYIDRTYDLSGITNRRLAFDWDGGANNESSGGFIDWLRAQYSIDGGGWNTLVEVNGPGNGTQSGLVIPDTGTNVTIRFWGHVTSAIGNQDERFDVDNVIVSGDQPGTPTNEWPKEAGGFLTLSGEGVDFAGTTDEGYYVYKSAADYGWFTSATGGWEMVSRVVSETVTDADGRSGVMLRSGSGYGSTSGQALEADAKTAGVYLTGNGNVQFVTRTTNGGATSAQTINTVSAPEWVKLAYDGSGSFTGWHSPDGAAWTQIGTAVSITLDSAVGLGLAQTSGTDGTFADASFDDFSVAEQVIVPDASKTPQLLDWTITYDHIPPPPSGGELTCVNCHNVHEVQEGGTSAWAASRVSDPDNTKTLWAGSVANFCLTCHDTDGGPSAQMSASAIVPYSVGMSDYSAKPFFPGWDKSTWWSTTVSNHTGGDGCGKCHDPHGSAFDRLTAFTGGSYERANTDAARSKEQNLCYSQNGCHGGGTTKNVATPFGYTYTHPVTTDDRHSDLEDSTGLGSSNRHSECVDCHDPHAAQAGTHADDSSVAGNALRGIIGVKPTSWPADTAGTGVGSYVPAFDKWSGIDDADYETIQLDGGTTDYEAYLCYKCHSSYTTQPTSVTRNSITYTPTDVAREFNPNNASGHNVMGNVWPKTSFNIGGTTYTWSVWSGGFQTGYDTSEMLTCTSCHEGQGSASGPHGSSQEYLIDSAYTTEWNSTGANLNNSNGLPTTLVCYKCHNNIRTINEVHQEHDDRGSEGGYCRFCHTGIPHGWKRPRLLSYTTDADPYAAWRSSTGQSGSGNYGLIDFTLSNKTPGGWNKSDCAAGCETGDHPDDNGTPWP